MLEKLWRNATYEAGYTMEDILLIFVKGFFFELESPLVIIGSIVQMTYNSL